MSTDINPFYKTRLFLTFLVVTSCFLFTYLYYGFYYVEYEALFDSFYSGKLTEGLPFRSIYFLGNIGISHLYSLLYQFNANVEWVSWILYFYLFVSCFIGMYLIIHVLPEFMPLRVKIAVQVAVYLLIFADHNIHFIFTRVSYMTTGFSLIALVYFFRLANSIKSRPRLFIFLNLWFIVGTLTRSESATAAFLQVCFFGIFYLQNIKRFAIIFLFPFLFLGSLLSVIAYDLKTSKDFYKQIEPDIEAQYTDRENTVPLSFMKTYQDTVKWQTAKDIMWSDPKVISPVYLRSLILPEKFLYTDANQWKRVYHSISGIAVKFWYLGLICSLLGFLVLIRLKFTSKFGYLLWFAFVLSFWFLTAIQTYTVKVNDRSYAPLISLFIFCHIIIVLPYVKSGFSRWASPIIAGIFILFCVHLYHLKIEANQLKYDLEDYRKNLATITRLAAGKILVVNSTSCDYLFSSNQPFRSFDFSSFQKVYITDGFNMPFLPYYRRYLEKECKCDLAEFPSFWDYLRTRHDEVVIISATGRMDIIKEYLRVIHKYDLPVHHSDDAQLIEVQKSDLRGLFAHLTVYKLDK